MPPHLTFNAPLTLDSAILPSQALGSAGVDALATRLAEGPIPLTHTVRRTWAFPRSASVKQVLNKFAHLPILDYVEISGTAALRGKVIAGHKLKRFFENSLEKLTFLQLCSTQEMTV